MSRPCAATNTWPARADLLRKLGRHDEARVEFTRAAGLTANARERAMLLAEASRTQ